MMVSDTSSITLKWPYVLASAHKIIGGLTQSLKMHAFP